MWVAAVLILSAQGRVALAVTQDHSLTYSSTAGMFEDMYDYFKYSPAYLPSFQKNAFWGQFSNLEDAGDQQINNNSNGSQYYLLGGQMDLMGAGRAGFLLDWNGASTPQNNVTDFTGASATGASEHTSVAYTSSDGYTIDGRSEKYGRAKRIDNQADYDVYAAYGLGNIAGFDLGAAVRGTWWDENPTYDPFLMTSANSAGYTFDGSAYARTYNTVTGALTSTYDRSQTGSLDYSSSNWQVILGGRSKNLLPNLDLVANIAPIFSSISNKLTADYSENYDFQPSGPVSTISNTTHISGAEVHATGLSNGYYTDMAPAAGVGVLVNARGDYTLTPSITLTGEAGFQTQPMTISDSDKQDYASDHKVQTQTGTSLLVYDDATTYSDKYTGTISDSFTYAKVRAQLASGKNWKLGAGLNYSYRYYKIDRKEQYTNQEVITQSGQANPHDNYVSTTNQLGGAVDEVWEYDDATIELPLGLVFNVLNNLPIRLGVIHSIDYQVTTNTFNMTAQNNISNTTVRGDGTVTSSVQSSNRADEDNVSSYSITHTNTFYYGASWSPYANVQIDFTGFATDVLALTNYRLSFSLYF